MDGNSKEPCPDASDRAQAVEPQQIEARSETVEIGMTSRHCLTDEDGFGTLTTLWYEYMATIQGIGSDFKYPVLELTVRVRTMCAPTGRPESAVIKDVRTKRVSIPVRQLNPPEQDRRIRIGHVADLTPPPKTFLVPESWVQYAWTSFDHDAMRYDDDRTDARRPRSTRKTEEARQRHGRSTHPSGTLSGTSEAYPVSALSKRAFREIDKDGINVPLPTLARSTFTANATGRWNGKMVVTVHETVTLWSPIRPERPSISLELPPRLYTLRADASRFDARATLYWEDSATLRDPTTFTFHLPRSWSRWAQPFPAKRSEAIVRREALAQTLEDEHDAFLEQEAVDTERDERHQLDRKTRELQYLLWRVRKDHKLRRRHTGTAREREAAAREIRAGKQEAEARRDRGLDDMTAARDKDGRYRLRYALGLIFEPETESPALIENLEGDLRKALFRLSARVVPAQQRNKRLWRRQKADQWRRQLRYAANEPGWLRSGTAHALRTQIERVAEVRRVCASWASPSQIEDAFFHFGPLDETNEFDEFLG